MDVVELLVHTAGADVNKARTVDGGTPLHIAAELGHVVGCCNLKPALEPPVSST